jgi:RNA polymerase sigma-70 factor (ECF subfamily)
VPTPNDLAAAYDDYRNHQNDETIRVLCTLIRSFARRLAHSYRYYDPDEAADSILSLAWASLDQFRGESSFGTWLHTLARRRLLDIMRADRRRPVVQLDVRREPDKVVTDSPLMEVQALTHLSDDERHLVQRLIETPDYDRLAQSLCISRKALESRLGRILRKSEETLSCLTPNCV